MAEASRPTVTVAMVTFNSERFVAEAIDSVLAQDFRDFELVICDDRSTDSTWSIVQRYADTRIRATRNGENLGEYPNRNHALALARGTYLMYLDGDDCLYPHGLGTMVRALQSHPRAAFASAQPPSEKFIYPVELTSRQFYSCQFLGPNVTGRDFTQLLFRTETLKAVGGFDPRFRSGDTHIQFVIGATSACVLIGDGLAWWRKYHGQASESLHRNMGGLAELARYGQELLAHQACPLDSSERRIAKANLCRLVLRNAYGLLKRGRFEAAWALVRDSRIAPMDWRYFFARDRRPYLRDVDASRPARIRVT